MYKITKEMHEEFKRVMSIRPRLYRENLIARFPNMSNEDAEIFECDSVNDRSHCLILSGAADIIYLAQKELDKDGIATVLRYFSQQEFDGKKPDWAFAFELNDGNFRSYCGIYGEENAPKIEAQAVLYTIEWYLQEAGLYEMPKWTNKEHEAQFFAQFKDFERFDK